MPKKKELTKLEIAEKKSKGLVKDDVLRVAKDLKMKKPNDEEVIRILTAYPSAQEDDPTGTWNLVIEDLLYNLKDLMKFDDLYT